MGVDDFALIVLIGLVIDALFGWPAPVYSRIGHPVTWMGALISTLDQALNRDTYSPLSRRIHGVIAVVLLVSITAGIAAGIQIALFIWLPAWVAVLVLGLMTASLIAQKSLYEHIVAVADALQKDGLEGGRKAVSMVVGRDPASLDEGAVGRAAVESLAENFSDGIVAPVFWALVGGLPGIAVYKAINTADSMVGHRTPKHEAFGWAAARLDDLVNLPASRLTAFLLVLAAVVRRRDAVAATRAVWRDARLHRSPNAGWPEAAMAGALGLALGGPRRYGGTLVEDVWMGRGRDQVTAPDIRAALMLFVTACALQAGLIGGLALLIHS